MSTSEINRKIEVGTVFRGGNIFPKWFLWEDRKYTISKVNLVWQRAEGDALIHYFSVSDECNSYEISFNSKAMTWKLNKAE